MRFSLATASARKRREPRFPRLMHFRYNTGMKDTIHEGTMLPITVTPPGALSRDGNQALPIIAVDMPVMYEDEGQEEVGETEFHFISDQSIHTGVTAHLADQPRFRVFSNLNMYYHPVDRWAYVSPDTVIVELTRPLPERLKSYRIGEQGPAPRVTIEVLSQRSFQQQDLGNKPFIYADLGVQEYILVDVTGDFLPQKLLLKRLDDDRTWINTQDPDGGVTSQLGFRLILEPDGDVRVVDVRTGREYLRPNEAENAIRQAESRLQTVEEQLRLLQERLRKLDDK